ncbi:MAG: phage integrase N-terminal SAM-like domain-containing protein, partial [Nanoarchaeota archaeon]|nr:phage integrase N-terminal SAM-like domain-containing protein [Nanoarchaeota archaeon]
MKKTNEEKLSLLLNDERLLSEQRELLIQWQQHIRKCTELSKVLERAYTITEFSIFLRRPLNEATTKDIQTFLQQKSSNVKETTIKNYKFRLQGFYRWIIKHTKYKIDEELAYPKPIVVTKIEVSREEMCKQRVKKILDNKQKPKLNDTNLQTLNDYHNYKITSGKVESYTGFVGKVYFLKRLGLFLGEKNYKEVKREDIQNFLSNVQSKINVSYKAHLL